MSTFHSAITGALDAVKSATAVDVQFVRGTSTVNLSAIPGVSKFDVIDDNGTMIRYQSRDFIVRASELEIDNEIVTPQKGDKIKEDIGSGQIAVHELMRPDGGENVWRFSDLARTYIRIHTKQVCTETGELGS